MITTEYPTPSTPFAAPFVKRQKEKLETLGVEVKVFHFHGGGNPLNYLKAWLGVRKMCRKSDFNLIHAQWGQSAVPALFSGLPLLITYRGDDLEGVYRKKGGYGIKSHVLKWIGRNVARFADHVIVVSEHMLKLFKPSGPVDVIPSGIDFAKIPIESRTELRTSLGWPTDRRIVIFPNDPAYTRKNFPLVENAIDQLCTKYPDLLLKVVYNVEHNEILRFIKAADFMFFASFHEGSPNVVKEALACNTAVISVPVADVPYRLSSIPGCFVSKSYSLPDFIEAAEQALQFDYRNFDAAKSAFELDDDVLNKRVFDIYQKLAKSGQTN